MIRTAPAGLPDVAVLAEVLHQAALHADARGPAREGRRTSGASRFEESGDVDAMGRSSGG